MEKKLQEMVNLFLANVENGFLKLGKKLFTYFDVDQSPITWVEINTDRHVIIGR